MEIEDIYIFLVGGYYGVRLMDVYPLKEFVLKDIDDYIKCFVMDNPLDNFDYKEEALKVKDNVSDKVKLQDALLVLNKINGSMDLVFLITKKLKKYDKK